MLSPKVIETTTDGIRGHPSVGDISADASELYPLAVNIPNVTLLQLFFFFKSTLYNVQGGLPGLAYFTNNDAILCMV